MTKEIQVHMSLYIKIGEDAAEPDMQTAQNIAHDTLSALLKDSTHEYQVYDVKVEEV
jgi:hypothetical protein